MARFPARTVSLFFEVPLSEERSQRELRPAGSAFVYRSDSFGTTFVLTAAHVVNDRGTSFWLRDSDASYRRARLVAFDSAADVAVLSFPGVPVRSSTYSPSVCHLQIRSEPLEARETVHSEGLCQHGDQPVQLSGTVAQPAQTFSAAFPTQKFKLVQLAMPVVPGLSGAPVVDDQGRLAGMVVKKFLDYGLALPVEPLIFVAEELIRSGRCEAKNLGFEVKAKTRIFDERTDEVANTLIVCGVDKGSLADKAGLKTGDQIKAVNGIPSTGSACDIHDALVVYAKQSGLELSVSRDGGIVRIVISG